MEDYEKKYKEALATAKDCLKDGTITSTAIDYIETIFPELAESEDERIRKALVRFHKSTIDVDGIKGEDIIAWLEKQGKSTTIDIDKMVLKYSQTREPCTNGLPVNCQIRAYRQGINDVLNLSLNLEKQCEQPSAIRWYDVSLIPQEMEELLVEWDSEDATWHEIAFYHADTKTFWNGTRQVENVTRWCYIIDLLEKQGYTKKDIDDAYLKGICDTKHELEKQGKVDTVSYEVAEKEKYDFVSGHFIKCRKSFDVFKEDNSYWFEYVGNDNYIGRSDNILNQKFHITPRQLYCLFTQEHCPKEDNANAPTEYGKYVDECLNDASEHFFSEGEDKYSVADLFYAGVRCGKSWFEKQGTSTKLSEEEQNSFSKGVLSNCALSFINYLDAHSYEGKMCVSNGECEDIDYAFHNAMWDKLHRYYCKYIEEQGEQKPILDFKASNFYVSKVDGKIHDITYNSTDKVEPKFKIGDVLCDKSCTTLNKNSQPNIKILDIRNDMYICNNCIFPISQQNEYELVTKKIEQKSAWSDEDERMYRMCVDAVEYYHTPEDESTIRDWLKSLKERITWKPSKEQIEALDDALNERGFDYNYLNSLYEQLKKL